MKAKTVESVLWLIVIVSIGIAVILGLSAVLDYIVLKDNQRVDETGNVYLDDYGLERYKVQVVEVHILAMGIDLAVELGLLAWWIDWRRRI